MVNVNVLIHSGHGRRVDAHMRACEKIWREVSFYCSEKCLKDYNTNQEVSKWHKKLSQGYQKCSGCVELFEHLKKRHDMSFSHACLLIKLVPNQGELCEIHQPDENNQKAQNYWNSLSKEARLTVIKNANEIVGSNHFADGDLTNEQLSEKEKVPQRIFYAFFASECDICQERLCKDWKVRSNNYENNNNENFSSAVSLPAAKKTNNYDNFAIIIIFVELSAIIFLFGFYIIKKNKNKHK